MLGSGEKRGLMPLLITRLTGGNNGTQERNGTWANKELLAISLSNQEKKMSPFQSSDPFEAIMAYSQGWMERL